MAQELKDTSLYADANLKAYYRFESGALTTDTSAGGHTLTAISDPAEGTGKFGGCVDLDGNDAYSVTDHADLKPTGAFSVGGWFKNSSATTQRMIFQSFSYGSSLYAGIRLYIETNHKLTFDTGKNSGSTQDTDYKMIGGGTTIDDNVWHLGIVTWDTSNLNLYIDGKQDATAVSWANAPVYQATNYVRVGCGNNTGTERTFFVGSLDDLFLLNGTALTATQVANLYDRGIKKINGVYMGSQEIASTRFAGDANLKAYYKFSTGALTTDSSGAGHTLTAISDPAEGTGKFGGGVDLDGNDAYSATDHADFKPTGAFTAGGWFKTAGGAQAIICSYSEDSNVAGWHLSTTSGGKVQFVSGKNSGTTLNTDWKVATSTTTINNNVFHQVTGTSDGTNIKIYVDGMLEATSAWANNPAYAATNYVRVGMMKYSAAGEIWYLTGSLDDLFLLSGTALTSDEIYSLYKTGVKKLNGVVNLNPELESTSLRGDANLVQYTKFEGNSTATVGSNGTDTAITYGTGYGKFGQGALFNGATPSYITIGNSATLAANVFSVNMWLYKTRAGTLQAMMGRGDAQSNADSSWFLYNNTTETIQMGVNSSTGGIVSFATSQTIPINTWIMATFVLDASYGYIYINGSLAAGPTARNAGTVNTVSVNTAIGEYGGYSAHYYPWYGYLDDISYFSRALTSTEISNLYNTNIKKYNGISNT